VSPTLSDDAEPVQCATHGEDLPAAQLACSWSIDGGMASPALPRTLAVELPPVDLARSWSVHDEPTPPDSVSGEPVATSAIPPDEETSLSETGSSLPSDTDHSLSSSHSSPPLDEEPALSSTLSLDVESLPTSSLPSLLTSSLPASVHALSSFTLSERSDPAVDEDAILAEALDELLADAWPLPLSRGLTPDDLRAHQTGTSLADRVSETPCAIFASASPEAEDSGLHKPMAPRSSGGAIRPPELSLSARPPFFVSDEPPVEKESAAETGARGEAPFEWVFQVRTSWGKPLALVAALLASHAAVLIIGIALGRRMTSLSDATAQMGTNASNTCGTFARRFSSGPQSMYTRLCYA